MQGQLERVQGFAEAAMCAASFCELETVMADAARANGADYYLMTHHGNFQHRQRGLVYVSNYPREFVEKNRMAGALSHDPIVEACERTLTGFFWADVGTIIPMTTRHQERLKEVVTSGLADGFVVPAHIPGENLGSCHFAAEAGKELPRENAAAYQSLALFGFEAARRLTREINGDLAGYPRLTDRQRECLIHSARGKSDTVIGQLLGLSPKTVNSYMEAAKTRYGVATRAQLIASALCASEITYLEVIDVRERTITSG
jgi:LuxR family quorum-sensing system transcriptional regulator CciR